MTTRRVLIGVPVVLLTCGIAQGVVIRTEWLTKPLMKAPEQVAGEATSGGENGDENNASSKKAEETRLSRAVKTLDDIIDQARKGSILGTLQGKGREILKDFEELSKREKGEIIEILKGQAQKTAKETTETVREKLEKVKNAAAEMKDKLTPKIKKGQSKREGTTALEKITRIVRMSRDVQVESELMLEIGSVLDDTSSSTRRKIKLLFIGDSLSACVGVDRASDGPVLQETVANHVQSLTGCDVEWYNSAVVGGTVREIRDKLAAGETPFLKNIRRDEDLVVVLICGLNDYKKFLFSLWNPLLAMKTGPMSFKAEVVSLLQEIRQDCVSENNSVFLPAIPVRFMASDPKFLFSVFPLSAMGLSLNTVWEIQKYNIAFEQQAEAAIFKGHDEVRARSCENTFYISEPDNYSDNGDGGQETRGKGEDPGEVAEAEAEADADVVAKDGVHLNSNGYKKWGRHLALSISDHLLKREQRARSVNEEKDGGD